MFEATVSVVSFLASMNSWLTPTVLFVLLHFMIGTIVVTSGFGGGSPKPQHRDNQTQNQDTNGQQPHLTRSPSVLQRLKSINFYSYRSQQTTTITATIPTSTDPPPSAVTTAEESPDLDTPWSENDSQKEEISANVEEEEPTMDQVYSQIQGSSFGRSKSDTRPSGSEVTVKFPGKMKKSAGDISAFNLNEEEEEEVERRGPATVREVKNSVTEDEHVDDGDVDEVDAKAGDFINRFRQQLKLQRMDSIVRSEEIVVRGGSDK
ncbi:hypothetical protein Ancab_023034 [Ancistrocladus abbreviatus]